MQWFYVSRVGKGLYPEPSYDWPNSQKCTPKVLRVFEISGEGLLSGASSKSSNNQGQRGQLRISHEFVCQCYLIVPFKGVSQSWQKLFKLLFLDSS